MVITIAVNFMFFSLPWIEPDYSSGQKLEVQRFTSGQPCPCTRSTGTRPSETCRRGNCTGHDQNYYLVINNYGQLGPAVVKTDLGEADLETTINDLMSGQYRDPVRVVAFNTAEHWAEDASEDVTREIMRHLDLAGHELPLSIQAFVDSHLGPDRQLTLRLA
jgi:hypothetical protein